MVIIIFNLKWCTVAFSITLSRNILPNGFPQSPTLRPLSQSLVTFNLIQEGNHKLYQSGTQKNRLKKDGVYLDNFSNTVGPIKFLCSVFALEFGQQFTSQFCRFINLITNIALSKLQLQKKKPLKRHKERSSQLSMLLSKLPLVIVNDT